MKKEDKLKVGRPKLADTKLKKSSIVISLVMLLVSIALLVGGLLSLNILPKFWKLKGNVPIYRTYNVGDEFCLGDECFYTIKDNGDSVTALAKYNIKYAGITNNEIKQSEESEKNNYIFFSGTNYWYDESIYKIKPEYGTVPEGEELTIFSGFPAYVYDSNSLIYEFVESYKDNLVNQGYPSVTATLLSREQAIELGCSDENWCRNAPSWVYQTNYWLGTATSRWAVGCIDTYKRFSENGYMTRSYGMRPVITIAKSDFAEIIGYESLDDEKQETDKYYFGKEICFDTECFNVIKNDGETLTMLAKYNLLVGNIYNYETEEVTKIRTTTKGYGLQNESAKGYEDDKTEYIGVMPFSDNAYWTYDSLNYVYDENSYLYSILEEYKDVLKNKTKKTTINTKLLNYEEAMLLLCNNDLDNCESYPEWYNQTSYWLGFAAGTNSIAGFDSNGNPIDGLYYSNTLGVRPVVTIKIEDLEKEEKSIENVSSDNKVEVEVTTTNKTVTTKKKATIKKWSIKTTTETKKEETTTTNSVVINKIVGKKTTTKAKGTKENNIPIMPIIICGIILIIGIGYGTYRSKSK